MSSDCPNCGEPWCPCAQLQPDQNCERRAKEKARREMDEFALSVGYGERPEGWESGVRRLSGEDLAGHWKQIERERDEAREAYDALVDTIRERIPYAYDDGTDDEATPDECVEYAADEIKRMKRERVEDDAEVVMFKGEVLRLRCALMAAERERDEARAEVEHLSKELCETLSSDDCDYCQNTGKYKVSGVEYNCFCTVER